MAVLYIIATPVGNLGDLSPRAREVLASLEVLACEDTRHTGNLLHLLEIPRPAVLLSNHEHNEQTMAKRIVSLLSQGKRVGICSDAGYPLISDPGYPAVVAALQAGYEIVVIPGASAAIMALLSSGLPPSSYTFKGFAPRKAGSRRRFLEQELSSPHTLIFYESPYRIGKLLAEALAVYGDRQAAVCLELSKQFERVRRGSLRELAEEFAALKVKGEAVIVIAGDKSRSLLSAAELEAEA